MSGKHRGPGAGVMPVEKVKDFKGTLKRLVKYIAPYKIQLIIVLITAILSTVFSILSPKILGYATQKLFEGIMMKFRKVPGAAIDFQYIGRIVLILIALYIISSAFSYIQQYVMAGVSQKTVYNMRKDLENKLGRMPLKYFDSKPHGETLSRFTNDMDNISTTLQQSLTQLITSIITIIGIIVMMLTISPLMTIIALIVLPVSILLIRPILKKITKIFYQSTKVFREFEWTY